MEKRPIGLETEYAIRFSPRAGIDHPGNHVVFDALQKAIEQIVATEPGDRADTNFHFFAENGGSFYYEYLPSAFTGGLLEGATPECYGPSELLLYQKAQETILIRAIPDVERKLGGSIGLIKNCRDAKGNVYGAQENYEAEVASPMGRWAIISTALLAVPVLSVALLILIPLAILLCPVFIVCGIAHYVSSSQLDRPQHNRPTPREQRLLRIRNLTRHLGTEIGLLRWGMWFEYRFLSPITFLAMTPYSFALRAFAFRKQRRALEAFLVSRVIITGAGTLLENEQFALSEKGVAVRLVARLFPTPSLRGIFDTSNLLKIPPMILRDAVAGRSGTIRSLFRNRRNRFQIGLSDSGRCQVAEYLKTGTTLLLLDMLDAGELADAPKFKKPVRALHAIVRDPALKVGAEMIDGNRMSAIDVQRWYLEKARRFVEEQPGLPNEHADTVRLWSEVLDALAKDPGQLVGRIDWVSKRYMLETAGADLDYRGRKKIDIGYHELGSGYFDLLEREGIAPVMVEFEEIENAIHNPPSPATARARSAFIKQIRFPGQRVWVSWTSAVVNSDRHVERVNFGEENPDD